MKIYDNDPMVPYGSTKIHPSQSRAEIDGLLARWGIRDSGWRWSPETNEVFVTFQMRQVNEGKETRPLVKIEAPLIYKRKTRNRPEEVNWTISLRVMWWYIKSHLEAAYLRQSGTTLEFLPHIQVNTPAGSTSLGQILTERAGELQEMATQLKALPAREATA